MSKTPRKTHSEKEHLAGEIKKLKSENRRLRKELNKLKKQSHMYESVIENVGDHVQNEKKPTCKHCGKGEVEEFDFVHIIIKTCNLCGHQRKSKPKDRK